VRKKIGMQMLGQANDRQLFVCVENVPQQAMAIIGTTLPVCDRSEVEAS
jgi:hypothetical protein